MRNLFLAILALPLFAVSQDKMVISSSRYFPKADKSQQFEKALAAHAQKYHTGDVKWRVFSIESGPDAGGYHVVEGPTNWDGVDKRGDLGKAHMDDWNSTVQIHLTERTSTSYGVFREDLSTVKLTDYADKVMIQHLYFKPGYYGDMQQHLANLKKVWEESKQSIAVYEASASGEPQFIIVTRYKDGLKERETGFREPFPARYAKVHGQEGWYKYISGVREMVSHQWSELLFSKPDLGSK